MARQEREILEQNTTAGKRDGWCLEVKRVGAKNQKNSVDVFSGIFQKVIING